MRLSLSTHIAQIPVHTPWLENVHGICRPDDSVSDRRGLLPPYAFEDNTSELTFGTLESNLELYLRALRG